jgi:uncharacterized protein with ATP-grasp and redox domains
VSHSGNPASLAYPTARVRWPKILQEAIIHVETVVAAQPSSQPEKKDGSLVIYHLDALLAEMENGAPLLPLPHDGASDILDWNAELEQLGPISWHDSPWLYTECYLYRRIQTCFSMRETPFWKHYDVFARQKEKALASSKDVIVELVQWLLEFDQKTNLDQVTSEEDRKALMEEFIQVSLWGNASDLLLLIHVSVEELQSRQGKKSRELFNKNVVDDDTEQVWRLLSSLPSRTDAREIHIVLDNSGFEFITDLILAAHLLAANYATTVVLHGKAMPWFVSDVTSDDLETTLEILETARFSEPATDAEAADIKTFASLLRNHIGTHRLIYEAHPFWTTQHPYARLLDLAPDLHAKLASAELVIFKGDLNYRKLVFDGLWPHATTFRHALGPLGRTAESPELGLRILALRTCKADTCVGLQPGRAEGIDPDGTGEWTRGGKYAVISFCDTKS